MHCAALRGDALQLSGQIRVDTRIVFAGRPTPSLVPSAICDGSFLARRITFLLDCIAFCRCCRCRCPSSPSATLPRLGELPASLALFPYDHDPCRTILPAIRHPLASSQPAQTRAYPCDGEYMPGGNATALFPYQPWIITFYSAGSGTIALAADARPALTRENLRPATRGCWAEEQQNRLGS